MINPEHEFTAPEDIRSYYMLASSVSPSLMDRGLDSFSEKEVDDMFDYNLVFNKKNRSPITTYDPLLDPENVVTFNDALIRLTPQVIRYASRNREELVDLLELGHVIGLRWIATQRYGQHLRKDIALSFWQPENYEVVPFPEWVPTFN